MGNVDSVYWTLSSRKFGIYRKGILNSRYKGWSIYGSWTSDFCYFRISNILHTDMFLRGEMYDYRGMEEPHPNRKLGYPLIHHPAPTP